MSATAAVMSWVMHVEANARAAPHELLGVPPTATPDVVQSAFYAVAKQSHPDRFRNLLTPPQLERLTRAYSRIADAYATMGGRVRRNPATLTNLTAQGSSPGVAAAAGAMPVFRAVAPTTVPPPLPKADSASAPTEPNTANQMNSKALPYFRRAETAFAANDLTTARLQLRLAIAADPASAYLRRVLAELDSPPKS